MESSVNDSSQSKVSIIKNNIIRWWTQISYKQKKAIWTVLSLLVITAIFYAIFGLIGGNRSGNEYTWGWYTVLPWTAQGMVNSRFLVQGLFVTIRAAFIAFIFSASIGLVVSLIGFIPSTPAKTFNRFWVEIFRSIPVLAMLFWVYYGLPIVLGIRLDFFAATICAMALCDSAFEAEIFRSGIQSISKDQHESARSIGLTSWQTMRYVVLPQAIRRIIPPLGNQFVYMLKVSSIASAIGLGEITRKAQELITTEYRPLEIYTFLIVEYLILILLASTIVRFIEKKLRSSYSE